MKKLFSIILALTLVMVSSIGVMAADEVVLDIQDFEIEFLAAPAVAGLLLEEAGIDNRYGNGKNGGNLIKDVAAHMGPGTIFEYPEGTVVEKTDVEAYRRAVALFLNSILEGPVYVTPDLYEAVLESVLYEGYTNTFGTHVGETLTFTFTNNVFLDEYFPTEEPHIIMSGVSTIGTGPLEWSCVGNVFTMTTTGTFNTARPDVGDLVTNILYLYDEIGNPVVVPTSGIVVDGIVVPGYALHITHVNAYDGYNHEYVFSYDPNTLELIGFGIGISSTETISGIVWDPISNTLKFIATYSNGYTWYPAFTLDSGGTLSFIEISGDNVWDATGTWEFVLN